MIIQSNKWFSLATSIILMTVLLPWSNALSKTESNSTKRNAAKNNATEGDATKNEKRDFGRRLVEGSCLGYSNIFNGTMGYITSKNYPRPYDSNSSCKATVVVSAGYHILFKFIDFVVDFYEGTIGCEFSDYVQFTDLASGYKTRKFCAYLFIGYSWYTSSNKGEISFVTNDFQEGRGFKIMYKAVKRPPKEYFDGCNGFLRRSQGFLTSPNYPYNYLDGEQCKVILETKPGKRLKFELLDFSLERDSHFCERDSLQFEDGVTGRLSEKFCGRRGKGRIWISDSNTAFVKFVANNGLSGRGYNMSYLAVSKHQLEYYDGCNGFVRGESGSLKSTNYPHQYYSRMSCSVIITVPAGLHILFKFEDFSLEETDSLCRSFGSYKVDHVQFTDLLTLRKTRRFCGTNPKGTSWFSASNRVKLVFQTNDNRQFTGFHITFRAIKKKPDEFYDGCQGLLKADRGTLRSPNYPKIYPNDLNCEVKIVTDPGKRIKIVFDTFQVGYDLDGDYVQITDQITNRVGLKYKNNQAQYRIWISDSHAVKFLLKTDSHYRTRGFQATYYTVNANETEYYDGCNGFLRIPRGYLTSPNYPQPYFSKDFCNVVLAAPTGYKFQFILQDFDISEDGDCGDFVQFLDLVTGHKTRKFCSDKPMGTKLLSQSNKVKMIFSTDEHRIGNGFKIRFLAVKADPEEYYDGCNGVWKSSQGILVSPNYPNVYESFHNCTMKIIGPSSKRLRLRFEDFHIENYEKTCGDNVTVIDTVSGKRLPYLCDKRGKGRMFISDSNLVTLHFLSGRTYGKFGFALSFKAQDMDKDEFYDGCNGLVRAAKGHLKSPNYPQRYFMFDKCKIDIIVAKNASIRIQIEDFQIVRDYLCKSGYLEMRDVLTNKTTGRLCGALKRDIWFSDSNHVQVLFETGAQTPEKGYSLVYTSILPDVKDRHDGCNGVLAAFSQNVTSPGFPGNYQSNEDCNTTIKLNSKYRIRIRMDVFVLGQRRSICRRDYLELRDLVSGRSTGKICGREGAGLVWTSDSNLISIYFHSDQASNHEGFSLFYKGIKRNELEFRSGCSGLYLAPKGVATLLSPNYPKFYPVKTQCQIHIEAPKKKRLLFLVNDFELETRYPGCHFDFVQFLDLVTRKESQKLCDRQIKGITWLSDSNIVLFKFLSDRLKTSRGYNITYKAVDMDYVLPDPRFAEVVGNATVPVTNSTWSMPRCGKGFYYFKGCLTPYTERNRRAKILKIWDRYYHLIVKSLTGR